MKKENAKLQERPLREMNAMIFEDGLITIVMYAAFAAYVLGFLGFGLFFTIILISVIRVFTIRHEKTHRGGMPAKGWQKNLSQFLTVYHTPYQETYAEKSRKHLAHHRTHLKGRAHPTNAQDPHQLLEKGPLAIFANIFYEEVMFYQDLKFYGRLTPDRAKIIIVSLLMIAATIAIAGLQAFLALFLAYRLSMALVWFFFSYVMHAEPYYSKSAEFFIRHSPRWLMRQTEWIFGSSNATVVMFHKHHHENPRVFFKF